MERSLLQTSNDMAMGYFGLISDELILMILEYLPAKDLHRVVWTCKKLKGICETELRLWTSIDDPIDNFKSINHTVSKLLNPFTRKFKLTALSCPSNRGYKTSLSPSMLEKLLHVQNLTELHLVRQKLDSKIFSFKSLPSTLKKINISGTVINNVKQSPCFFKDVGEHLTQLEDLDLSNCNWIFTNGIIGISKLPNLVRLNMRGCRTFGECLAYVSLAGRFGFQRLKILDVTDTLVGSTEFTAFGGIPNLEEFYFGQYDHFVDQEYNNITDLCFYRIINSRTLRIIDMSGSLVSDGCLDVLGNIPSLERVEAHFTGLTEEGIQKFRNRMPNCQINRVESVPLPNGNFVSTYQPPSLQSLLQPGTEIIEIFFDAANNISHRIYHH